jgi:hypothetical protein
MNYVYKWIEYMVLLPYTTFYWVVVSTPVLSNFWDLILHYANPRSIPQHCLQLVRLGVTPKECTFVSIFLPTSIVLLPRSHRRPHVTDQLPCILHISQEYPCHLFVTGR